MTFLEALYGSQYSEIDKQGKDGNKGRLNANVLLAAFIFLLICAVFLILFSLIPGLAEKSSFYLRMMFGHSNGKVIGKILAIPVFALIYVILSNTVGSKKRFAANVNRFMHYPKEKQKKANVKLLLPFFILLVVVFGLAMTHSFS